MKYKYSCLAALIASVSMSPYSWAIEDFNAKRFLFQSTFGEKETKINELVEIGINAWFVQQLNAPVTSHVDLFDMYNAQLADKDKPYARNQAWLHATLNGEDQLRQRMAFALSQILVVSRQHDVLEEQERALASYYDLLSNHALGNYKELLREVTINPVMGSYLDLMFSQKTDDNSQGLPNENYPREIMQLMTVGPVMLRNDGSVIHDSQGKPVPTYSEPDIPVAAKILSGWEMAYSSDWGELDGDWFSPMHADNTRHDTSSKSLLGTNFPSGLTAEQDLDLLLDTLIEHQNTAPFISFRLIQRFTTSNPSGDYIARVSDVFRDNGNGETGDLFAVIKAILTDVENVEGVSSKFKEPMIGVVNYLRLARQQENADNPRDFYPSVTLSRYDESWPQHPLNSPDVFNFYAPTDAPDGVISDAGLYSPEQTLMEGEQYKIVMDKLDSLLNRNEFNLHREFECRGGYNGGTPFAEDLKMVTQFMSTTSLTSDFHDGLIYMHNLYEHKARERCGSFKFFSVASPEFWVVR